MRGLDFFGFPLHAPGKPSDERGRHLSTVGLPMLFLQGARDRLADLTLLRPLCERLQGQADLYAIDNADHSFHVPKKSGRSDADVLEDRGDGCGVGITLEGMRDSHGRGVAGGSRAAVRGRMIRLLEHYLAIS